jgi:hypothetical protein
MQTYVIERTVPGVGNSTESDLRAISQKSVGVLNNLGPDIEWLHSYVTGDKIYCVYRAANEEIIREHARQGGFPADSVSVVASTISPKTAG